MSNLIKSQLLPAERTAIQQLLQTAMSQTVLKSKPYTAYITRKTPSAMLFLIDQSGSMDTEIVFQGQTTTKAQAVALTLNTLLDEILNRCNREGELREYFQIGIIGYGNQDTDAYSAWQGALEGKAFVRMSQLRDHYLSMTQTTVEQTIRGRVIVSQKPVREWITPQSGGLTPMKAALELASDWLEQWIVGLEDKDCYPPIVINITDGEATDGDETELLQAARRIKSLHTADGNVLLLNVHLSDTEHTPVLFPQKSNDLPEDNYAQLLYRMSSEMPAIYNTDIAHLTQKDLRGAYTGMAFNANIKALVSFLQIGTTTSMGRTK